MRKRNKHPETFGDILANELKSVLTEAGAETRILTYTGRDARKEISLVNVPMMARIEITESSATLLILKHAGKSVGFYRIPLGTWDKANPEFDPNEILNKAKEVYLYLKGVEKFAPKGEIFPVVWNVVKRRLNAELPKEIRNQTNFRSYGDHEIIVYQRQIDRYRSHHSAHTWWKVRQLDNGDLQFKGKNDSEWLPTTMDEIKQMLDTEYINNKITIPQ